MMKYHKQEPYEPLDHREMTNFLKGEKKKACDPIRSLSSVQLYQSVEKRIWLNKEILKQMDSS